MGGASMPKPLFHGIDQLTRLPQKVNGAVLLDFQPVKVAIWYRNGMKLLRTIRDGSFLSRAPVGLLRYFEEVVPVRRKRLKCDKAPKQILEHGKRAPELRIGPLPAQNKTKQSNKKQKTAAR
jgi:hypothetical protein